MTPEKAREILGEWFTLQAQIIPVVVMPVYDIIITTEQKGNEISQWTFRGLIKIAYDL